MEVIHFRVWNTDGDRDTDQLCYTDLNSWSTIEFVDEGGNQSLWNLKYRFSMLYNFFIKNKITKL